MYAVLNAAGLLLIRTAFRGAAPDESLVDVARTQRFVGGFLLYGLGFIAWILSLRRYELSIAYPLFVGVGYCTVIAASVLVLNESASPAKIAGFVLVGLGLLLVLR